MIAIGTLIAAATLSVATPTANYRRTSDSGRPAQVASRDAVKGKGMLDVYRPRESHASPSPTHRATVYFLSLGK